MENEKAKSAQQKINPPSVALPKGGGAIRGMGEKFAANPVTGTGSMSIPIATSPGRSGFGPQLNLSYDSGSGNGPFGFGWSLSIPSIRRKTDKGLPRYFDSEESDVYLLSGAEDLVPLLNPDGSRFTDTTNFLGYTIHRYRPRIEGLFARIERWTNNATGTIHWRSITKDNITTWYGKTENSRIFEASNPAHIFEWLICESYDEKGNLILYQYKEENSDNVDTSLPNEANRTLAGRSANRYLKRIKYGNRAPNRDINTWQTISTQLPDDTWMFEVVLDYGDEDFKEEQPDEQGRIFVSADLDSAKDTTWPVRQDAFSTYRASFEVRTYRLCRRVLMFHHFPEELGVDNYLVRSTEFTYQENPIASYLNSVTQSGYVIPPAPTKANRYLKKSLPPVEFVYSPAPDADSLARQPIVEVDSENLENLPIGLDVSSYQWMDLDGEGTSGILTEQANGWYYKRNLSANNQVRVDGVEHTAARFGAMEIVTTKPASGLAGGAQFLDLAGDGQADLVQMEGAVRGFYERTRDGNWESFQPFTSWPNLNTHNPNLRFVDLTGDGHADILITEQDVFLWHLSLTEAGFGPAERTQQPWDEEKGPRLVFDDGTQSIYLADLSGDGLSDLARIRNGEVCYWPNLGYGRFGAKVIMDHAPWFDEPDLFDHKRIRLVDTDGSGTTDIIYLHREGVRIYFNQCGNSWSDAAALPQFPDIDNIASIQALDLQGNGTACLVWSSPLPGDVNQPMRYIALMEEKPHLLISVKNNLGAETRVHYAPSTKFYLNDKQNKKTWITRLPFPVHVVEQTETVDLISRNRFVTRYAYHHGYFDGEEREFRGFGMMEQWDTEEIGSLIENISTDDTNWDAASYVPPAFTRTWFHTGAFIEGGRISKQFEHEYYREGDPSLGEGELTDAELEGILLPDTVLTDDLTADEIREACRSLKGCILRQEVYALDRNPDGTLSEKSDRPYSVSERNYTIQRLQPRGINKHAVFFTHAREQIDCYYERTLVDVNGVQHADPRLSHAMTLAVDDYGNVLRAFAIAYRRRNLSRIDIPIEQKETHMVLTVNRVANRPDEIDWYRIGLPVETRTYEIVRPPEPSINDTLINLFRFEEMDNLTSGLFPRELHEPSENNVWPYEKWDWRRNPVNAPTETRLRLIEHVRTLYRKDELTTLLPLGDVESLALPGESYKLAFTPELITQTYAEANGDARVTDDTLTSDGHYVHIQGDANWWIPSGQIFFSPNTADLAEQELAYARVYFFLPHRYRDPFEAKTVVHFDAHNLLIEETQDALGNTVIAENDYRVLQPTLITDPNGNRTKAVFDALGMVAGTAVMGKPAPAPVEGDWLDEQFKADLIQADIDRFHDADDPHTVAVDLLKTATTRIIYDLHRFYRSQQAYPDDRTKWEAPYAATLARETHGQPSKIQISFSYSDGFGREIQKKVQAEPGPIIESGPDISPRWVASGWTIFNNKGKPVRQYEPFFDDTHQFKFGNTVGVSPILFYDPVGRVVATLHPNHTYEKVVFDPWQQTTYDVNDTVKFNPQADPDVSAFFGRLLEADYLPTWYQQRQDGSMGVKEQSAAEKAAIHAGTPTVAHVDSLGRTFLTIARNKFERERSGIVETIEEEYFTSMVFDIEGNQRAVIDAKGRIVMRYDYNMLGDQIHQVSMDAGARWVLNDVTGKPTFAWDLNERITDTGVSKLENRVFHAVYDPLHRPLENRLSINGGGSWQVIERFVYGEGLPDAPSHNLRGQIHQHYDSSGLVTNISFDFKGNLLKSNRQLASAYDASVIDWRESSPGDEIFIQSTTYDALNRMVRQENWHLADRLPAVYTPQYNERGILFSETLSVRGQATQAILNIEYNAKGQRTRIEYGNGTTTRYHYDPQTFRLMQLRTTRTSSGDGLPTLPSNFGNPNVFQNLYYTYDPAGNIINIYDDAFEPVFFNNQKIEPNNDYTYDAIYRLTQATGRENYQSLEAPSQFEPDSFRVNFPVTDHALRNYTQYYAYDAVGNIEQMRHSADGGSWTRNYEYALDSNRLLRTWLGNDEINAAHYNYDTHGSMLNLANVAPEQRFGWDYHDMLQHVNLSAGQAWYNYDAGKQRTRKRIERNGTTVEERLYLGGMERYRRWLNGNLVEEIETYHLFAKDQRVLIVEDVLETNNTKLDIGILYRYQYSNHLGSVGLELNAGTDIISYEEYYPYGTTAYHATNASVRATAKRYRYTGMERDEETGLNCHTARYYLPWLGRWTSTDPLGVKDGLNVYKYVQNNPIILRDITGTQSTPQADPEVERIRAEGEQASRETYAREHARSTTVLSGLPGLISLGAWSGAEHLYEAYSALFHGDIAGYFEHGVRLADSLFGGVPVASSTLDMLQFRAELMLALANPDPHERSVALERLWGTGEGRAILAILGVAYIAGLAGPGTMPTSEVPATGGSSGGRSSSSAGGRSSRTGRGGSSTSGTGSGVGGTGTSSRRIIYPTRDFPTDPAIAQDRGYFGSMSDWEGNPLYLVRTGEEGRYGMAVAFRSLEAAQAFADSVAAEGRATIQLDYAIPDDWPNSGGHNPITGLSVYQIRPTTGIIRTIAPQIGADGVLLPGGASEVLVPGTALYHLPSPYTATISR